jgi:hypothetical protein
VHGRAAMNPDLNQVVEEYNKSTAAQSAR